MHVRLDTMIDFLNEADILIEKLQLIAELAPLIDEAPLARKLGSASACSASCRTMPRN